MVALRGEERHDGTADDSRTDTTELFESPIGHHFEKQIRYRFPIQTDRRFEKQIRRCLDT